MLPGAYQFLIITCNVKFSYLENELCSNKQIDQGKETQHTQT